MFFTGASFGRKIKGNFTKSDVCVCVFVRTLLLVGGLQSRTQGPQAFWTAVGRQERLWGTGILLP